MAISASYRVEMSRALPGQVSDTSAYNIDGACVLDGDVNILVGVAVQHGGVDSMGNKKVKLMASEGKAYGVAIRSHFQTTSASGRMMYEAGGGINVMNEGRVWMLAVEGQTKQNYGTAIKIDASTGRVDTESGTVEPNWIATGDFTEFQGLKLIEVQVKQ
nr:MAG TPA: Scaffolding protein SbcC like [Caudoviricetes sp.]